LAAFFRWFQKVRTNLLRSFSPASNGHRHQPDCFHVMSRVKVSSPSFSLTVDIAMPSSSDCQCQLARLYRLSSINADARLVRPSGVSKYDHTTPVLRVNLHVLKNDVRITFKLGPLSFKCLKKPPLQPFSQHFKLLLDDQLFRSPKTPELSVPCTCTSIGSRWTQKPDRQSGTHSQYDYTMQRTLVV
jgi:hypothetical protein